MSPNSLPSIAVYSHLKAFAAVPWPLMSISLTCQQDLLSPSCVLSGSKDLINKHFFPLFVSVPHPIVNMAFLLLHAYVRPPNYYRKFCCMLQSTEFVAVLSFLTPPRIRSEWPFIRS